MTPILFNTRQEARDHIKRNKFIKIYPVYLRDYAGWGLTNTLKYKDFAPVFTHFNGVQWVPVTFKKITVLKEARQLHNLSRYLTRKLYATKGIEFNVGVTAFKRLLFISLNMYKDLLDIQGDYRDVNFEMFLVVAKKAAHEIAYLTDKTPEELEKLLIYYFSQVQRG